MTFHRSGQIALFHNLTTPTPITGSSQMIDDAPLPPIPPGYGMDRLTVQKCNRINHQTLGSHLAQA